MKIAASNENICVYEYNAELVEWAKMEFDELQPKPVSNRVISYIYFLIGFE